MCTHFCKHLLVWYPPSTLLSFINYNPVSHGKPFLPILNQHASGGAPESSSRIKNGACDLRLRQLSQFPRRNDRFKEGNTVCSEPLRCNENAGNPGRGPGWGGVEKRLYHSFLIWVWDAEIRGEVAAILYYRGGGSLSGHGTNMKVNGRWMVVMEKWSSSDTVQSPWSSCTWNQTNSGIFTLVSS